MKKTIHLSEVEFWFVVGAGMAIGFITRGFVAYLYTHW